jgi:hypothetical protein
MKEEIESRFHLLITISLFFPVLIANLGTITGQTAQKASLTLIQTSIMVGFYLVNYILFQNRKDKLTEKSPKWISFWLLVALGIFIVPILGLAILSFNPPLWIGRVAGWLSGTSVLFILAAAPVIETVILFSAEKKR